MKWVKLINGDLIDVSRFVAFQANPNTWAIEAGAMDGESSNVSIVCDSEAQCRRILKQLEVATGVTNAGDVAGPGRG